MNKKTHGRELFAQPIDDCDKFINM